jgi:hypothetical protein
MASTNTKILVGAGVLALVAMGASAAASAALGNIDFTIGTPVPDTSTSPIGANGEIYLRVDLPITVQNANPFPIGASGLSGVVTYGNIVLAQISDNNGIYIASNSTHTIKINIDVPTQQLFRDMQQAIQNQGLFGALANVVFFNGKVMFSGLGQTVSFPITNVPIPVI